MCVCRYVHAAAVPRRDAMGFLLQETVGSSGCTHDEEFCLCRSYLDEEEKADQTKVYYRIFSIQADTVGLGTGVTVRVQRYYYTRKHAGAHLKWKTRWFHGPTHDATVFEQRCETPEALRECLYSTLGVGFNDVLLFVHGYNNTLSSAEERALLLRRKTPSENTLVGVFSFNSAADGKWLFSAPLCTCAAASPSASVTNMICVAVACLQTGGMRIGRRMRSRTAGSRTPYARCAIASPYACYRACPRSAFRGCTCWPTAWGTVSHCWRCVRPTRTWCRR